MLPPSMVCRIRHLKIYTKHKGGRRGGNTKENKLHGNCGVSVDNLIKINTEDSDHTVRNSKNIAHSLLNAQSLKKKDETLHEILSDEKTDIYVVTETWISDGPEERA